jgi:hypothetical protein
MQIATIVENDDSFISQQSCPEKAIDEHILVQMGAIDIEQTVPPPENGAWATDRRGRGSRVEEWI